jgi:arginase
VWMDAHGDINTPETSTSGNLHGMPLAALLGLFVNPLGGPHLRPENLILIGVRDLDPAEVAFIDHLKIKVITSKEARAHPDRALHALNEWLDQVEPAPIHLSFDIDSLDPEWAPATGLRVPLGLQFDFCKKLVLQLAKRNRMVSFDLVEINPEQTFSGLELKRTLDCAQDILLSAFNISSPKEITL